MSSEINEAPLELGHRAKLVPVLTKADLSGLLFGQVLLALLLEVILALEVQSTKG